MLLLLEVSAAQISSFGYIGVKNDTCSTSSCCADLASGSSNLEVPGSDEHIRTRPVRRALLTQDSLDRLKLEERRRKLLDDTDGPQGASLGLEPADIQLIGPIIDLSANAEAKPLDFEPLQEKEVTSSCCGQPSAQACNSRTEIQVKQLSLCLSVQIGGTA